MSKFLSRLVTFNRDKRGVTALEYGLIAALIAVAIVSGVTTLGSSLSTTFSTVASKVTTANK